MSLRNEDENKIGLIVEEGEEVFSTFFPQRPFEGFLPSFPHFFLSPFFLLFERLPTQLANNGRAATQGKRAKTDFYIYFLSKGKRPPFSFASLIRLMHFRMKETE